MEEGDFGAGIVGLLIVVPPLFPVKAFLFPLLDFVELGVATAGTTTDGFPPDRLDSTLFLGISKEGFGVPARSIERDVRVVGAVVGSGGET